MKKKLISFGVLIVTLSIIGTLTFSESLKASKADISSAHLDMLKAENASPVNSTFFDPDFYVTEYGETIEDTASVTPSKSQNSSSGDLLGGLMGGAGSVLSPGGSGGLIDSLGNIVGGVLSPDTQAPATAAPTVPYVSTTASIITGNTLIPVPAASPTTQTEPVVSSTIPAGETVDYGATANPYTKPTTNFKAGDRDETIKWIQWIFIYTRYGLKDNGITGRLDDDTVAVIKKLQQEKGLTIDGNLTAEVVDKAELLYLEYTLGADTTARYIEPSAAETLTPPASDDSTEEKPDILPIIIIISVIWIITVIVILVIFVLKKKKLAKEVENTTEEQAPAAKPEKKENSSGVMSMSDLFEDAGKK